MYEYIKMLEQQSTRQIGALMNEWKCILVGKPQW